MGYWDDLRVRVIRVVERGGTARGAARQFEIVCRRLSAGRRAGAVAPVRMAIEAVGAELRYIPPYSPDFNPLEQLFAKLKRLLRKPSQTHASLSCWSTSEAPFQVHGLFPLTCILGSQPKTVELAGAKLNGLLRD
jgi:transposase